jgi:hypothetical protein
MILSERNKIVFGLAPVDITGAAKTGVYVSMKNYRHLAIIIQCGVLGATAAVTLKQAKTVAGTDEKALSFTKYYISGVLGSSDALTEVAVASNTFDISATGDGKLIIIDVDADSLDVNNGFDCVNVNIANPGTSSFLSILEILTEPRYANDAMPSAIVD